MKRSKNSEYFSNLLLSKLLNAFGIKKKLKTSTQDRINLAAVFHPFSIYLHLATCYSLIALFRTWTTAVKKSVLSSTLSCILSLIVWHIARIHGQKLHNLVENSGSCFENKVISRRYSMILTTATFSVSFLFPIILAFYFVFGVGLNSPAYIDFWFAGNMPKVDEWLQKLLLFMCVFVYMSQQILFPGVLLIFFCVLNLKHAEKIEGLKFAVKTGKLRGIALSKQFYIHRSFLLTVKKQEEVFTFLIFLILCLLILIAFTGLALLMGKSFLLGISFTVCEGILNLYFSTVGIISITYSSSVIHSQFEEINEFYRMEYESRIFEGKNWLSLIDEKKLRCIKMMYKQETPHFTAWNIVRLDKNLVFSVFGGLLTYGFLFIQLKKDKETLNK